MLITKMWKMHHGVLIIQVKELSHDMRELGAVIRDACEYDVLYGMEFRAEARLVRGREFVIYVPPCCRNGVSRSQLIKGNDEYIYVVGSPDEKYLPKWHDGGWCAAGPRPKEA